MFKTLLATCLLTFSCSGNSLKAQNVVRDNDQKVLQPREAYSRAHIYTGSYNFVDFDYFLRNVTLSELYHYECDCHFYVPQVEVSNGSSASTLEYKRSYYICFSNEYESASYQNYLTGLDIYVDCDENTDVRINLQFNTYSGNPWFLGFRLNAEAHTYQSYYPSGNFNFINYESSLLYFVDELYFGNSNNNFNSNGALDLLDIVFDKRANFNNSYYTGWYTFDSSIDSQVAYNVSCLGSCLINNNVSYGIEYRNSSIDLNNPRGIYYYTYDVLNNVQPLLRVQSGFNNSGYITYPTDTLVYFNGVLLNEEMRYRLNLIGTFGYIPDTTNYDFFDLLTGIADTPFKFLYNMLDIELFGLSLFTAFAGLIALLMVLFVIRKFL